MKAYGTFYVMDIEKIISRKGNNFCKITLVNLSTGEDIIENRLRNTGNAFKAFYMGNDIEICKKYKMELFINVYNDGNDIQIYDVKI